MNIYYHSDNTNRKELSKALGEILNLEPRYLGVPTCAYTVGNYTITKDCVIECPDNITRTELEKLIEHLVKIGFQPASSDLMLFVASLPKSQFDQPAIDRLYNLVSSKEYLLKAALNTNRLNIEIDEEKISFPWFTLTGTDGEVDAFVKLVAALGRMAREQKRISPTEKPVDNLKYAMRLFLVRLGFVGDEYKTARKILLSQLSGNSSWRSGHRPENTNESNMNGGSE